MRNPRKEINIVPQDLHTKYSIKINVKTRNILRELNEAQGKRSVSEANP